VTNLKNPSGLDPWLRDFHEGHKPTLERFYREHHAVVSVAVATVLEGADRETVVHEAFYRILTRRDLRENFQGGNLGAWLSRVAKNLAIDHRRRHRRETLVENVEDQTDVAPRSSNDGAEARETDAKRLVERFRAESLPQKWAELFELRFIRQLGQYEAAEALGIARSTLVYQEQRVRELLRAFVLDAEGEKS
jgi:RNA polymerase sigma-70 factor (ECF subfamily)